MRIEIFTLRHDQLPRRSLSTRWRQTML